MADYGVKVTFLLTKVSGVKDLPRLVMWIAGKRNYLPL
jgi:hypothetical protein